ncbi:MAG TPA: zinc-binding alcohol dehydrogenase family protein [Candidatus Baltobacteraceae bacterium]|nr:zinc-binding alcohol dehydrogenase family protein [Candidatus Baltobacteraceae bacterium]
MKAAIVTEAGKTPVYGDFKEPVALSGEDRIAVIAAALSHLVILRASGSHYSSSSDPPFVVGVDGVGRLDTGKRVYFFLPKAPYGSMAEVATVPSSHCLSLSDELDDVTAAAIAIPGMSSWAAYKERAKLQVHETVLVHGATGASGRLAVQIAKYFGAKRVIATGRNPEALRSLKALGADVVIPLTQDPDALEDAFKEQFAAGIDVVVDYLWGKTAELLLIAAAKAGPEAVPIRFVQIGSASGENITLQGAALRSSSIVLMGSGLKSIPIQHIIKAIDEVLQATIPGKFEIATQAVPLSKVEQAWRTDDARKRTVFTTRNIPL